MRCYHYTSCIDLRSWELVVTPTWELPYNLRSTYVHVSSEDKNQQLSPNQENNE